MNQLSEIVLENNNGILVNPKIKKTLSLEQFLQRAVKPIVQRDGFNNTKIETTNEGARIKYQIPPYIINYRGNKYFFDGTEVILDILNTFEGVKLTKPKVPENYDHPFKMSGGNLCYNDDNDDFRWKSDGISFRSVSNYQTKDFAEMVKDTILHGYRHLVKGYFDPRKGRISPVKLLTPKNYPEQKKRGDLFG